ncbi:MAG: helix-turn-helix domain-containing protein [Oscillospiraceae bacterium]|nr:helix-turn-helix domain-containing protein [Oscillospiraceae bacterium]
MFKFNEHLKMLRKNKNITQEQFANAVNTSNRAMQNYEQGKRKPPYDTLIEIADFFDVSLDYLVGRCDNPDSHK